MLILYAALFSFLAIIAIGIVAIAELLRDISRTSKRIDECEQSVEAFVQRKEGA